MDETLEPLFEAVRRSCKPAVWSRGVELVRAGAVVAAGGDDDELRFRIARRGGMISRNVSLFPEDAEWDCGCDHSDEACEHVAAAVIALQRSSEGGEGVRSAEEAGKIVYRFTREPRGLGLERWIVTPHRETRLNATLAAVAEGRVEGPPFAASQSDLAIELAMRTHRHGVLAPVIIPKLFQLLSTRKSVELDGARIRVGGDPLAPVIRVDDAESGVRLSLAPPRPIDERFANGVVRSGDTLLRVQPPRLNARELESYRRGVAVPPEGLGELVTELIPALKLRIDVDVATDRLPETEKQPPRIHLKISRQGERLEVLPLLVYGDPPTARVDGGRLVHLGGSAPVRDQGAERRVTRLLADRLGMAPGVRERFFGEAAVRFAERLERWDTPVEAPELEHFQLRGAVEPVIRIDGDRFDVRFVGVDGDEAVEGGGPSADPAAVVASWRSGQSLVPLMDGGYGPLPLDWLARYGSRIADLIEARGPDGRISAASMLDLEDMAAELDLPPPTTPSPLRRVIDDFEGLPAAELPADLDADLRTYQRSGIDWLVWLRGLGLGALLADDMGLGKTLQAIAAVRGRTLVVAPTSVLHNWKREIERFRPGLSCSTFHGPRRQLDPDVDVTLTSYAILRIDREKLTAVDWDIAILDEAQAIKNPDSRVARAAYALQAQWRATLTGTPVENRLDELWSQFHYLNRGFLGGREDFRRRYSDPITVGDAATAARLRERIRPFVLRRLKSEVARDLPARTDVVRRCELTESERDVYRTIQAATRQDVISRLETDGNVLAVLEALMRLRQAACHPSLVPGHVADGSSKLELLIETLDEIVSEGHRALVFSQWTSFLDLTEPVLQKAGLEFLRLDGSTRDRASVVDGFQAPDGPPVLLISLRAGGVGLNLTAADHVFLLDPWWNPAVEDQAADRAHRIGQDKPVIVHRLIAADTVEERILALQESKRRLADAALAGGGGGSLTRDDLLALLD